MRSKTLLKGRKYLRNRRKKVMIDRQYFYGGFYEEDFGTDFGRNAGGF